MHERRTNFRNSTLAHFVNFRDSTLHCCRNRHSRRPIFLFKEDQVYLNPSPADSGCRRVLCMSPLWSGGCLLISTCSFAKAGYCLCTSRWLFDYPDAASVSLRISSRFVHLGKYTYTRGKTATTTKQMQKRDMRGGGRISFVSTYILLAAQEEQEDVVGSYLDTLLLL